ncbi:MAG: NPCBM/NEW2 domain-containing protein [Lentisphaeria bacterium]|nr:NPCBM/NEW2 domain-containing protein [Lentisphaeria bacterium]
MRRTHIAFVAALVSAAVLAETQMLDDFETDHSLWGGAATAESATVRQGRGALRWTPNAGALERSDLHVDFERFRTLRFWLHADSATFARIQLSAGGRSLTFKIDWTGWARFDLPAWRFKGEAVPGIRLEQTEAGFEPTSLILDSLETTTEWPRIRFNENEELIDWMYWGARTRHLWTFVEKSGEGGLTAFWSWGTFWLKETAGRDTLVYERRFDTDISDSGTLEVRIANDGNGYLSIHLQIDGVWSTPVAFRKGFGRFDEIQIPLPEGARRLNVVRLDLSEPQGEVGGALGRDLKCNLHWLMLRKRGASVGDPLPGIAKITPIPLNGTLEEDGFPGGIYFGREELPRIRALFHTGVAKTLLPGILKRADGLLGTNPELFVGRYNPQSNWVMARKNKRTANLAGNARACALAFALTGEKKYADHARRALLSLCRIEEWTDGPFARFPRGWGGYGNPFTEGSVTYAAGLAFDWAYPAFTDAERTEVRNTILHKGVWWTYDRLKHSPSMLKMNQGVVFDSEIGCALIVLAALDPALEPMLRETEEWIWQGIDAYSLRDGASTEGVGYWNYTWNTAVKYLAALAQRDPERFRTRCPGNVRRSMDWLVHMKSNAEEKWRPVAVCDARGSAPRGAVAALFAKYLDSPTASWFQSWDKTPPNELAAFIWEHDTPAAKPPMLLARHFRQAGYVFLREGFEYGDFLFGLLATPRLAGHYQYDQGAFMLEAFGSYLAMDPGMISYANPIHRSLADSRLHNTLTVDGRNTVRANLKVTRFFSSLPLDVVSTDLTSAYPAATRVIRHALYLRPDHVVIADEVVLKKPGRIEWNLNSEGTLTLAGTRLLACAKNGTLIADFAEPRGITLETEEWPCGYSGLVNHHGTITVPKKTASQRFLVSLHPVRPDREDSVHVESIREGAVSGVRIRSHGLEELVLWSPGGGIAILGIATDADFAVMRRRQGTLEAVAMVGGTALSVDGQEWLRVKTPDTVSLELHSQWAAVGTRTGQPVHVPPLEARDWPVQMVRGVGDPDLAKTSSQPKTDPQTGCWYIHAASPSLVKDLIGGGGGESCDIAIEADGEDLPDGSVRGDTVPGRIRFRLGPGAAGIDQGSVAIHFDGRRLDKNEFEVATDEHAILVSVDVARILPPQARSPKFFATHRIEVLARSTGLLRKPFRATCRFSIRPKIAGSALFLSDIPEDAPTGPRLVSCFAHGGLILDKPYSGDRIRLAGADFPKGLTTHPETDGATAYAKLVYNLGKGKSKPKWFRALAGMQNDSTGSVVFIVATRKKGGAWQERVRTETIGSSSDPMPMSVDLTEADELRLTVTDAGDGISCDHAIWAMARFE